MKYKLHYAPIDLGENDIPCYDFNSHKKMIDFIDKVCYGRGGDKVWLIAKDDLQDIFISESYITIQSFLHNMVGWKTIGSYYLQEYSSYEEAYKVALSMKEDSPLCYL